MDDLGVGTVDGVCHTGPVEGSPSKVGLRHSFVFWKLRVRVANRNWGRGATNRQSAGLYKLWVGYLDALVIARVSVF